MAIQGNGSETGKVRQVQINLMDSAGEWYQAHQVPAGEAALRAIAADIQLYSGTYSDADLRRFRDALRTLDAAITARIGQEG